MKFLRVQLRALTLRCQFPPPRFFLQVFAYVKRAYTHVATARVFAKVELGLGLCND